jgi:hypothetical protein
LAKDPISNSASGGVGPGLAFAKKLAEEQPDITIGLVPLAVGGTSITQWSKGNTLYNEAMNGAAIARQKGIIKGILWHQGEHDAIIWNDAIVYGDRFRIFAQDIRKDLGIIDLPIIVGGLSSKINETAHAHWAWVTEWLKEIPRQLINIGYVRSMDVPLIPGDNLHFSVAGQRMLGERYCDEYLRIAGYWTQQLKERLDASALELEDGWKYHNDIGIYFDEHFPIIKQAQLGWLELEGLPDQTIRLNSQYFGSFRTLPDEFPNAMYIYRENIDPELIHQPGDIYYVNLRADETTEKRYYNHTTAIWSTAIADEPLFITSAEHYFAAERMFVKTQESSAQTVSRSFLNDWSDVLKGLRETEKNRTFTILYANESFWYAHRNEPNPRLKEAWRNSSMSLLNRIDEQLINAQIAFQEFVSRNQ